jgi:cation:H+ antiporter
MDWVLLVISLGVILGGAELFTNGVEWIGEGFGLSEGAVGSILAAVGTALPETIVPLIAILFGAEAGDQIGVGAIVGSPFMLSTLAMCILGAAVLLYARRGRRSRRIAADPAVPILDLSVFLTLYSLAVVAGIVHVKAVDVALAVVLVVAYGFYVRRHFRREGTAREGEPAALKPLHLGRPQTLRRTDGAAPTWLAVTQTVVGLIVIVAGARVFVSSVAQIAEALGISARAFALLVAPVATELPETFNAGVIWSRRGKDTLAVGNITGALVFQSVFPVSIGLLLTDWHLTGESLVAALVALAAAGLLLGTLLTRRRLSARLLLFQGVLYAGYVTYVLTRLK